MAEMSQESKDSFTQAKDSGAAVFEVGFHIVPTVEDSKVSSIVERIKGAIAKANGSVIAEEAPKRMTLAYRIERSVAGRREKYTEAWFGWVKFEVTEGEGEQESGISALEAALRADHDILRFILIHTTREASNGPREIFSSNRLEGATIKKQTDREEKGEVSEEELDKTLESIVS